MKRIVLVRPSGPRNVGLVLRSLANFGPAELVIAGPVRPSLLVHPDFEQMSHGVEDVAAKVRVVDDLRAALDDCTWSVGFTKRARVHDVLRDWGERRSVLAERARRSDERVAFVFGNEVHGLTTEEGRLVGELARIATSGEHDSINLAVSASIVLADLFTGEPQTFTRGAPLQGADREFLKLRLADVLAGIARSEPIAEDIRASVERVFSRAPLETRDARAWHAVLRALGDERTPADFGLAPSSRERGGGS